MISKSLLVGALSIAAIIGIAGCGAASTPTPTASSGGLLPNIPGLGGGSTGSAPAANTLLTAADVQSISGDAGVSALTSACSATTCIYSDTTGSGGGGGVIFVEPFPGGFGQAALQAAIATALSGQANSSGGSAVAVSGLGSGAIKEIEANSVTYAFVKDNYLVVLNVSSGTKTGAGMDSQVGAAAQTVAGSL
ncbi:MAG: hypothetical protein WAW53_15685 [Candidatus Dormiibacterota bacterium]